MLNTKKGIYMDENSPINSTVKKLGAISFFADVASEMLYPITPILLTTIIGASVSSVGIIEGIAESIASLMKTYSGMWSDKIAKRRPFILIGYFLGAVSKPIIGFSNSWIGVLSARAIDRTGKGLRSSPRDALIADCVSENSRGAAFGWHRMMDTLGATVGPLIAILFLKYHPDNLRSLYYWAIIPGLLSVIIIFSIKETPQQIPKKSFSNPFKLWKNFDIPFKEYVFAWGIFSLTNSSDVFLLLRAKDIGFSTIGVILLYCTYNLTYALSSPYLGKLSDKIDRKKLLIAGLLTFSCVYVAIGTSNSKWTFWVLFLIYGLYMGATDGVGKALAVDLSPKDLKASSLGIISTITGLCTIFASSLTGIIWEKINPSWAFYYGAIGALVSAALIFKLIPKPSLQKPNKTFEISNHSD